MELGQDISQKIRSAVKSKLLDLGAYVDDELPDYVMVMVANKKNQAQMTEDLNLFLGPNTSKFTDWLHCLLEKLMSITADGLPTENIHPKSTALPKRSNRKTNEPKQTENGSPEDSKSSATANSIKNLEANRVSEQTELKCDSADGIFDSKKVNVHLEHQKNMMAAANSAKMAANERSPPSRKRLRQPEKQQRGVGRKDGRGDRDDEGGEGRDKRPSREALMSAMKEAQDSLMKRGVALSAMEKNIKICDVSQSARDTVENCRDLGSKENEFVPDILGQNNVDAYERDIQLYPYEIEGDVEMLSPGFEGETNLDGNASQEDAAPKSATKSGDVDGVKQRKIFVSERGPGSKPERTVAVVDVAWNSSPEVPPKSISQVSMPTSFIVTLNGAYSHLGQNMHRYDDDDEGELEVVGEEDGDLFESVEGVQGLEYGESPRLARDPFGGGRSLIISEEEEEECEFPSKRQKVWGRCKYWPKCKAGDDCQYHHPSELCQSFPRCHFKEKCMYIHPVCKFNSSCTNPECPFTHTTPRAFLAAPTVILQPIKVPVIKKLSVGYGGRKMPAKSSLPASQIQCRFFPNCIDMSCPYSHPKPCRYGLSCINKNRCPFTHPSLPTKDKLRWVARAGGNFR